MEEEDAIMEEIGTSYAKIYAKDNQIELHVEERQQVLGLITNKLTAAEQLVLDKLPDVAEIEEVVIKLPNQKALGLDGITTEVVRKCWE